MSVKDQYATVRAVLEGIAVSENLSVADLRTALQALRTLEVEHVQALNLIAGHVCTTYARGGENL